MEETRLLDLVRALDHLTSRKPPDEQRVGELNAIIVNSKLDDPANIPVWLIDLLDALVHMRPLPPTQQIVSIADGGIAQNFLVELADVVDMDYIEGGEYFVIQFPTIDLEAIVSLEQNNFSVRLID